MSGESVVDAVREGVLEIRGVTKRFPGVVALDGVDLRIERGEVHVLVGANGAGKSSLVRILSGVERPDEGEVRLEGRPYRPRNATEALRAGIRVVYQELNLLKHLSVAENVLLERLPRRWGLVDFRALHRDARGLLGEVGLNIAPGTPVERLGVAQMQLVEIAKAMCGESKILVLDEPTATLTPPEIGRLFSLLRRLTAKGVTVIYISHRLQEVFEIGDRVTVLRDGRVVATLPVSGLGVPALVRMMVGKDLGEGYPHRPGVRPGDEALRVEGIRRAGGTKTVSFAVRHGELLGVAGLVGSGRTETMRAIFGADPKDAGRIFLDGTEIRIASPRDAVRHGIGMVVEDRKGQGVILDMSCEANITLADLRRVSRGGVLRRAAERRAAGAWIENFGIRTRSPGTPARSLSGGNQQKLALARWLFRNARVLILDEPTRGVDVGAKQEIYEIFWRLAEEGKALVIVSSDLPELLGLCHRIVVFSDGAVSGELDRAAFDQEEVLSMAYRGYLAPAGTQR